MNLKLKKREAKAIKRAQERRARLEKATGVDID